MLCELTSDRRIEERNQGTPQGSVISPLLSNLYLHYVFDKWMQRQHVEKPWCRYADDGLVHCKTRIEAETLLEELKLKREFTPEIIFVDYLNICASQRMKQGANVNSYTYVKAIAEEIRGLAVEYNVPIVSATQTTRSGFTNSDPGLEDTSESFGLPATADFMFALVSNEELEQLNQIIVKQLKNRYNDPNYYKRFVIGIDRAKMKLYDVEVSAQEGLSDAGIKDDKPLFDKSDFGKRLHNDSSAFNGFKF